MITYLCDNTFHDAPSLLSNSHRRNIKTLLTLWNFIASLCSLDMEQKIKVFFSSALLRYGDFLFLIDPRMHRLLFFIYL